MLLKPQLSDMLGNPQFLDCFFLKNILKAKPQDHPNFNFLNKLNPYGFNGYVYSYIILYIYIPIYTGHQSN